MVRGALAAVAAVLAVVSLGAQLAVIDEGTPMTLRGEIIEISCYQKKGVAGGTGEAHIACAKECAAKGLSLGILTDGDGLFRIVGPLTENNNAQLVPYLGQTVELAGVRVHLSNTYDIRQNFDAQKIARIK